MGPFWTIASEIMPRNVLPLVVGLVNAFGNVGGYVGQKFVGWLSDLNHSTAAPFNVLGLGMLACAGLAFLLPKARLRPPAPTPGPPSATVLA
jgi:MFS family permease